VPYTLPNLTGSNKIKYAEIEVVWGRAHAGVTVKSSAPNSPLHVNPAQNGTVPNVADNLRVRDTGVSAAMETTGGNWRRRA
jgi:hypothetical protein